MNIGVKPIAVLDTCALFPNVLRDLLLQLAADRIYYFVWSTQILDELQRNLYRYLAEKKNDHAAAEKVARLVYAFGEYFASYRVEVFGADTAKIEGLPDAGDAHVVALAEKAGAGFIVTENLRDFPAECLPAGCVAVSTDDFVRMLFLRDSAGVFAAVERIAARSGRKGPQYSVAGLLDVYARILPRFGCEMLARNISGNT